MDFAATDQIQIQQSPDYVGALASLGPAEYEIAVDELEQKILAAGGVEGLETFPYDNVDCPECLCRMIHMPAGFILTSHTHLTKHPFVVLTGECVVITQGKAERIKAPYAGVTEPGTRRVIVVLQPTVWATYHGKKHPNETFEEIQNRIIKPRQLTFPNES